MRNKVRAFIAAQISPTESQAEWKPPVSLEWMPAGERHIYPMTGADDGITVVSDENDAAKLDAQLQEMLKKAEAGEASRPYIDFDHTGAAAAAIPVRFFWDDGIRLEVQWTGDGEDALRRRSYSYFSPEFHPGEDGHPQFLPQVGSIGSLVNTPAFQDIERLAAMQKPAEEKTPRKNQGVTMSDVLKVLVEANYLPSAKIEDAEAATIVRAAFDTEKKRMANLEAKVTETETKLQAAMGEIEKRDKAEAEAAVDAAVKEEKFADKPEVKAALVRAYLNDKEGTKNVLASTKPAKVQAGHPTGDLPKHKNAGSELTGLERVTASFAAKYPGKNRN